MGSFEQQPQQERNLEADRSTFVEAVSAVTIEEMPTTFDEEAVQKLAENLEGTKLFILGEIHGVKENVDVIYTLFKKFGFRQLALEWEPNLKNVADKFLNSGEIDFDAIKDSPDGRITAGHFALLKKLHSEGMLEELICFDGGSGGVGWNARDSAMSINILAGLSYKPTLVVAGNLHSKTEPVTFDDESGEQHPMGENIKKEIPDVSSGRIEYVEGHYHNFGTKELKKFQEEEALGARFYQDDAGIYLFEIPMAHAAVVPNPSESI